MVFMGGKRLRIANKAGRQDQVLMKWFKALVLNAITQNIQVQSGRKRTEIYTHAVCVGPIVVNNIIYIQVNRKGFWDEGNDKPILARL